MLGCRYERLKCEEQGFTLPELMATISILGILIAIAVMIWLGILEQRRVDAAANQLASDLRLAHNSSTNQLTDWRVVLVPQRGDESKGPDYFLLKLKVPYESGKPKPEIERTVPRTFPANVWAMNEINVSNSAIQDTKSDTYYVSPDPSISEPTRTLELNTNGAMTGYGSPSGTVRVTIDENPKRSVRYLSATSRIKVLP